MRGFHGLFSLVVSSVLLGFVIITLAPPTSAQEDIELTDGSSLCGLVQEPELLQDAIPLMLGPWQMEHLMGEVWTADGPPIVYPSAEDNETITLEMLGDQLVGTHPEMQVPMELRLETTGEWGYDGRIDVMTTILQFLDIENTVGCKALNFPRLIGRTALLEPDGLPVISKDAVKPKFSRREKMAELATVLV